MSKIFEELNTNTDALSLLGGEMSKLFDLVKIAMRLSSFFSGGDLLVSFSLSFSFFKNNIYSISPMSE